jgi:ABC-type bacteriocin/lantibiotic exporter with double-glycine peptidase domain
MHRLSLGQLIAFCIISGYVTSLLLRLTQLWQNFQETAIPPERIADILDTPMESTEIDRGNIPMPRIYSKNHNYNSIDINLSRSPVCPKLAQFPTTTFAKLGIEIVAG